MGLVADILNSKSDLIILSSAMLYDEEVKLLKTSKSHSIVFLRPEDNAEANRQKLHQVQFWLSSDVKRKPFVLITTLSERDFSQFQTMRRPELNDVDIVCLRDQLNWLANGKVLVFDAIQRDNNNNSSFSLTPIEQLLESALKKAGIEFEAQVKLGKYTADFIVRVGAKRFLVEADGRAYHNYHRDKLRDKDILQSFNLQTLRLRGGEIFHDPSNCISKIRSFAETSSITHRQPLLEDEDRLDASQKTAIAHKLGSARVVAPAGSGKTKVLVNHVGQLIQNGASPSEILCLAFNRDARDQMETRLRDMGISVCSPSKLLPGYVTVATLNSFGYQITLGGTPGLNLLTSEKSRHTMARKALDKGCQLTDFNLPPMRGQTPWITLLNELERVKSGLIAPVDGSLEFQTSRTDTTIVPLEPFFTAWEEETSRARTITFTDQIYYAVSRLMSDAKLRARYQNLYRYIVVDEFQDLNPAQLALVKLLAATGQQAFAVGDDDQLIYTWRHVDDSNIRDFQKDFGFTEEYALTTNYRSSKAIIDVSQRLISFNKNRIRKRVTAGPNNPFGVADLRCMGSVSDQLGFITSQIKTLKKARSVEGNSIAVLTRQNAPQILVAYALDRAGIARTPLKGAVKLFTTPAANILRSYLSLVMDPNACAAETICEVVNKPNRYLSNEFVSHLQTQGECWQYLLSFRDALSQKGNEDERFKTMPPGISDKWRKDELVTFIGLVEELSAKAYEVSPAELIIKILKRADFRNRPDREAMDQSEVTDEMIVDLILNEAKRFDDVTSFISYFDERIEYEVDGKQPEVDQTIDKTHLVHIGTFHSSKGLEWDNVFLFDIYDQQVKSSGKGGKATKPETSEEDRRVFYVGMTRARLNLYVLARPDPMNQFILEAFLPKQYTKTKAPLKKAHADIEHLKTEVEKKKREIDRNKSRAVDIADAAHADEKRLKSRLRSIENEKDINIGQRTGSWLATKIFSNRVTVEQKERQRAQIEKDLAETRAKLDDVLSGRHLKQIEKIETKNKELRSNIREDRENMAELSLLLPNLEQIEEALSPKH